MTTSPSPSVYVADAKANVDVRAVAIMPAQYRGFPQADEVAISYDFVTFHTVLYRGRESGPAHFSGKVEQPALDIRDVAVSFADGKLTYDGNDYVLDERAGIEELITVPVMRVGAVIETHAGYYVQAQNLLTGKSHDFLGGVPLEIIPGGGRARCGGTDSLVEDRRYAGHQYLAWGDHMDVSSETATFDGQPAKRLDPEDFVVTFADDLTTVTVVSVQ